MRRKRRVVGMVVEGQEEEEQGGMSLLIREGDTNLTIHLNISGPFYQVGS